MLQREIESICEGQSDHAVGLLPAASNLQVETAFEKLGVAVPAELRELYTLADGVELRVLHGSEFRFSYYVILPIDEMVSETVELRGDESESVDVAACIVIARTELSVFLVESGENGLAFLHWDPSADEAFVIGRDLSSYFAYWRSNYVVS